MGASGSSSGEKVRVRSCKYASLRILCYDIGFATWESLGSHLKVMIPHFVDDVVFSGSRVMLVNGMCEVVTFSYCLFEVIDSCFFLCF